MTQGQKILIGIFTAAPLIMGLVFFLLMFGMFTEIAEMERAGDTGEMPTAVIWIFVWVGLLFLITIAQLIFYCMHAWRNERVKPDMRIAWLLIFIFGGWLGMVVYYFMYILQDPKEGPTF